MPFAIARRVRMNEPPAAARNLSAVVHESSTVVFRPFAVGIGLSAVAIGWPAGAIRLTAVGIGSPAVAIRLSAVGFGPSAVAIGLTAVGVGLGAVAFVSFAFAAFCVKPAFGRGKTPVSGVARHGAGRARHSVRADFCRRPPSDERRAGDCPPHHTDVSPDFSALLCAARLLMLNCQLKTSANQ